MYEQTNVTSSIVDLINQNYFNLKKLLTVLFLELLCNLCLFRAGPQQPCGHPHSKKDVILIESVRRRLTNSRADYHEVLF